MRINRLITAYVRAVAGLGFAVLPVQAADSFAEVGAPPAPPRGMARIWPSTPPADCPFPQSDQLVAIGFTGRHANYTGADTWYPCWAANDKLYSPWTDGGVNGVGSGSIGDQATTGHATITGDDPLHLTVSAPGVFGSSPKPYRGRYPAGSLVHDGVWYYGTYCLAPHELVPRDGIKYNWPWLGPLVGFRWSTDYGQTWTETPHTPAKPLFGESGLKGEPVKIGAAHFVDFGKAMEHSPDGKAYLVSHGASDGRERRFAYNSWITGDELYLLRVTPSIENMNDASKYEFFTGRDAAGAPIWSREFSRIQPMAAWRDNMGCATITYNAPLKKYLLCVTDGGNTVGYFNTYLLESDQIAGPWKLVSYLRHFGEEAYFVNIPSKFISADGKTIWLCYSANFSAGYGRVRLRSRPPGSAYCLCLQEVRLFTPADPRPEPTPLDAEDNLALAARLSTSSVHTGYDQQGAVDGIVGGFPKDETQEWATDGEADTAMLRLTWDHEQTVDRVWLFDRPNDLDQIQAGMLIFSDGSTIATGALPDDARKGLEVRFAPKRIRWLILAVTATKPGTPNVGLAEIAVFRARS